MLGFLGYYQIAQFTTSFILNDVFSIESFSLIDNHNEYSNE